MSPLTLPGCINCTSDRATGASASTQAQIVSANMLRGDVVDFNGDQSFDLLLAGADAVEIHANNGIGRLGLGDRIAPELTLLGEPSITIPASESYIDAGATAVDDIDGDVSEAIIVSGNVNPTAPGTYVLTFSVADRAGNTVTTQRSVTVEVNTGMGGGGGGAVAAVTLWLFGLLLATMLLFQAGWRRKPV